MTLRLELTRPEIDLLVAAAVPITAEFAGQARFTRLGTDELEPLPAAFLGGMAIWAYSLAGAELVAALTGGTIYYDQSPNTEALMLAFPPELWPAGPDGALPATGLPLNADEPLVVEVASLGESMLAELCEWEAPITEALLRDAGRFVRAPRPDGIHDVSLDRGYLGGRMIFTQHHHYLVARIVAALKGGEIYHDEDKGGFVLCFPSAAQ